MNLNTYKLTDDWGWFVDIENSDYNIETPSRYITQKYIDILPTIKEDYVETEPEPYHFKLDQKFINIGTRTILTAIISYIVFCIII